MCMSTNMSDKVLIRVLVSVIKTMANCQGFVWTEDQMFLLVVLSQKHSLKAVSRHTVLFLRLGVALRVGATGRGALRGAQVVHEG